MPEIPDVGAIAQQVKARIKHIEDQLKQHHTLNEELDRLRDALSRLEGGARSRVGAPRRTRKRTAKPPAAPRAPPPRRPQPGRLAPRALPPRSPRGHRRARRAVRTRPRCSTR